MKSSAQFRAGSTRRGLHTIARVTACALLWSALLPAQSRPGTTVVVHVVQIGTGAPLPGTDVRITDRRGGEFTDSTGTARLGNVPEGRHTVEVRRLGYRQATATVLVEKQDTVAVSLSMEPTSQQLATVTISDSAVHPLLAEFEERRKHGTGRYITAAQIEQSFGSSLDALLNSHFPRVRMQDGQIFTSALETPVRCPVVAYLDGMKLSDGRVNDMHLPELAGVEYYTMNQIPVQYKLSNSDAEVGTNEKTRYLGRGMRGVRAPSGTLRCGVVLFWSKPR